MRCAFSRRADLPAGVFLAANVSPHLLDTQPLQEAFDEAAPLNDVVVELTEHVDPGEREPLLRALLGLRLAERGSLWTTWGPATRDCVRSRRCSPTS